MKQVTFKRISNGQFDVYKNDVKSEYMIINGSIGCSGTGNNVYHIWNRITDKRTFVGCSTIAKAKKVLTFWLED
jgi:hypothetical protein